MRTTTISIFILAMVLSAQAASPPIIQVTSGTVSLSGSGVFGGMTLTTPAGGPWNNITFNLYATPAVGSAPASNPIAVGTAFLLTQPYWGTPANLSSSSAGYVAASTSISGGAYVFPAGVVINPNTQYWLYENTPLSGTLSLINDSHPDVFVSLSANTNFAQGLGELNYTLGGTLVAAGGCSYSISPGGRAFPAAGGTGTIAITTGAGCAWSAASPASWIKINGATTGTGNGSINYQVTANTGTALSGPINITATTGNLSFTVTQGAASVATYTNIGSMSQLASAGSWTTTFTFVNTGSTAAQMRLNFFDNNGNPLALPLTFPQSPNAAGPLVAATLDQTINADGGIFNPGPGNELVIQTTGPLNQATQVGWAQLLTNGNISGFALFSQATGAAIQDAVVPLETRNTTRYIVPYDNTNGSVTGIALANLTPNAVNVTMNIRVGGVVDASPTLNLPAMGHTSFNLADLYSDTVNRLGTLEFITPSAGQISVLGLRFNSTAAFSSIPPLAQ